MERKEAAAALMAAAAVLRQLLLMRTTMMAVVEVDQQAVAAACARATSASASALASAQVGRSREGGKIRGNKHLVRQATDALDAAGTAAQAQKVTAVDHLAEARAVTAVEAAAAVVVDAAAALPLQMMISSTGADATAALGVCC